MRKTFLEFVQHQYLKYPTRNLGIERNQMPQISSDKVKDFMYYMKSLGHRYIDEKVKLNHVKCTQKEFNDDKIVKLMKVASNNLKKPILLSKEGYLLDGHHRFLALYNKNQNDRIPAIRFNVEIYTLLNLAKSFPDSFSKSVNESKL